MIIAKDGYNHYMHMNENNAPHALARPLKRCPVTFFGERIRHVLCPCDLPNFDFTLLYQLLDPHRPNSDMSQLPIASTLCYPNCR